MTAPIPNGHAPPAVAAAQEAPHRAEHRALVRLGAMPAPPKRFLERVAHPGCAFRDGGLAGKAITEAVARGGGGTATRAGHTLSAWTGCHLNNRSGVVTLHIRCE